MHASHKSTTVLEDPTVPKRLVLHLRAELQESIKIENTELGGFVNETNKEECTRKIVNHTEKLKNKIHASLEVFQNSMISLIPDDEPGRNRFFQYWKVIEEFLDVFTKEVTETLTSISDYYVELWKKRHTGVTNATQNEVEINEKLQGICQKLIEELSTAVEKMSTL